MNESKAVCTGKASRVLNTARQEECDMKGGLAASCRGGEMSHWAKGESEKDEERVMAREHVSRRRSVDLCCLKA